MAQPKICIWSTFRDDAGQYIRDYRQRIEQLYYPRHRLRLYLVEGDSLDSTYQQLLDWAAEDKRVRVIKADSGLPRHGHTTTPERFRTLAQANNAALDQITADNWGDYALLIESDLRYEPDYLANLLKYKPVEADMFCPMVWLFQAGSFRFYDIWAYRNLNGEAFPIYNIAWYRDNYPRDIFEIESAGSSVLFKMDILRQSCRYDDQVVRGMCLQARARGFHLFVDPALAITHPPED